jgi:hypothetical protein
MRLAILSVSMTLPPPMDTTPSHCLRLSASRRNAAAAQPTCPWAQLQSRHNNNRLTRTLQRSERRGEKGQLPHKAIGEDDNARHAQMTRVVAQLSKDASAVFERTCFDVECNLTRRHC